MPSLLEQLTENRLMQTPEQVTLFDATLAALPGEHTDDELRTLLRVFDDCTEHFEVMWGLVHYVESVPQYLTLQAFLTSIADMQISAKEWADILMLRLLNADDTRASLPAQIVLLNERNRLAAISTIREIESDASGQLKARASEVLAAVRA